MLVRRTISPTRVTRGSFLVVSWAHVDVALLGDMLRNERARNIRLRRPIRSWTNSTSPCSQAG